MTTTRISIALVSVQNAGNAMTKRYTSARRLYAWIGFLTLYLFIPLLVAFSVYLAHYFLIPPPRSDPFYQQTPSSVLGEDAP